MPKGALMNISDLEITVRNTDSGLWQVSMSGLFKGDESISFTVLIPRSDKSIGKMSRDAVQRAADLLLEHLQATASQP